MLDILLASISYQPIQRWGPVSPHGVGTAAGFLLGALLMARQAEPRGIPRQEVYNAVTWGAVGAIIGARGFYVLAHLDQFSSIVDVVSVWQGGLTMFGGFVGGLVLGLGYMWRQGIDLGHTIDAAAPGFVAGVACGRIGDIIIADHLGTRTDFFLGYRIPEAWNAAPGYGPPTYVPGAVVHHTALYDLMGVAVLAIALLLVARLEPPKGTLFAFFSLWYGLQRFAIDFTRNRELIESSFFGLSGSQWAGLGFALGGTVLLIWIALRRRHPDGEHELEPAPVGAEVVDDMGGSAELPQVEPAATGTTEPPPADASEAPAPASEAPALASEAPAPAPEAPVLPNAKEPVSDPRETPATAPEGPVAPSAEAPDHTPEAPTTAPESPTEPPPAAHPTPEPPGRLEPPEEPPPGDPTITAGEEPRPDDESSAPPMPSAPEEPPQEDDEGRASDA